MTRPAGDNGGKARSGPASVAVIGGGLAGLAAAAAMGERGLRVELFEAGGRLGGRAGSSFRDPASGELIDASQHVSMGCCTNLADFLRRTGNGGSFRRRRNLHFVGPRGGHYHFAAVPWLPAPMHLLPGLMQLGYLGLDDRLRILRTLGRLARLRPGGPCASASSGREDWPSRGAHDSETIAAWLARQGESDRARRWFWSVMLLSALGETLERASVGAARKVFVDGFLASRHAYELEVPRGPLAEVFDRHVGDWLAVRGVAIHRHTRVARIEGDEGRARSLVLSEGSPRPFDYFVSAVPWRAVGSLVGWAMRRSLPALAGLARIEPAPITAVHLWLDRPVPGPAEAVLVGRLGQWLFRGRGAWPQGGDGATPPEAGCRHQVVVSASHELVGRPREEVARRVRRELAAIWPAARRARLLRWRVITHREAVFSVRPGVEQFRPPQETSIANLVFAGDWTSTGWPATMEGAVRSGYLAAEAVLRRADPARAAQGERLPVADLPQGRLARWMVGADEEPS